MRTKPAALTLSAVLASSAAVAAQTVLYEPEGDVHAEEFGWSVHGAGDVDGDGFDDVIVGSPDAGSNHQGIVRVFSGSDGSLLYEFLGTEVGDNLGWTVGAAGDVDADGHPDIIAGAPGVHARVYSGADGSILHEFTGNTSYASAVSGAGDVNADGHDDFIIGAWRENGVNNDRGWARVHSGSDGSLLYVFQGDADGDRFAHTVSDAGDVNADGYADVIVGALAMTSLGYARVFSGKDGTILHDKSGDTAFASSVSGAGDVDADGHDDFMVGEVGDSTHGTNSGKVWVYSGADGSVLHEFYGQSFFLYFGHSVSDAGDVDGDGHDDVIVGAYQERRLGDEVGSAKIYSGADGTLLYQHFGDSSGARLGFSVASAGDVNADGFADLVAGIPWKEVDDIRFGAARIFSGVCTSPAGYTYCTGSPNSVGPGARIGYSGSTGLAANDLVLTVSGVPPGQFGVFFFGFDQHAVPFGNGWRCTSPPLIRLAPAVPADAAGEASLAVDFRGGMTVVFAGDTPNFQFWYRDPAGSGAGFNLSDALALTLCR